MHIDSAVSNLKELVGPVADAKSVQKYLSPLYYELRPMNPDVRRDLAAIDFPEIDNSQTDTLALFPDFYPGSYRTVFKAFLAHILYQKGVGSVFIFGDKTLPVCANKRSEADCVQCMKKSETLADILGLNVAGVGEFYEECREIPQEVEQQFPTYAEGSVKRQYRSASVDYDDPEQRRLVEQYTQAGRIAWHLTAGADEHLQFHYLVINMGPGFPGRGCLEYGIHEDKQILGIADPDFGHGCGYILNKGEKPMSIYMADRVWNNIKNRELTPQQQERVHEFMRERFETGTYQKHANEGVEIEERIDIETGDGRDMYVMFTHLLWDAAIDKQVSRAFADHNDWVIQTIERFRNSDKSLIVKTHPAETIRGTNDGVMDMIDRELASVPPNVDVLPPDTKVNTYDLVEFADTSLVFASTTGLESSYMGTPAITVGDAHYVKKGFTHDAESVGEYWDLLDQETGALSLSETEQQRALNYTYNFFIERPFYIDAINPPQLDEENKRLIAVDSYQEIIKNDTLDRLGESIIQDDNWIYYR